MSESGRLLDATDSADYRALEDGAQGRNGASPATGYQTPGRTNLPGPGQSPAPSSHALLVPDTMTLQLMPYAHEVDGVAFGEAGRAGGADRSMLVPPAGFDQLDIEYAAAIDEEGAADGSGAANAAASGARPIGSLVDGVSFTAESVGLSGANGTAGGWRGPGTPADGAVASGLLNGMGARSGSSSSGASSSAASAAASGARGLSHADEKGSVNKSRASMSIGLGSLRVPDGLSASDAEQRVAYVEDAKDFASEAEAGGAGGAGGPKGDGGGESTMIYPGSDTVTDVASRRRAQQDKGGALGTVDPLDPYRALLKRGHKLGQFRATAICGNDATGSIFYATGPCVSKAGVFAPISIALVSFVLYLFRAIYGEAVTSLPLNGGAYNVLLNTTKKSTAAIAAVLTLLSYTATAVVSAAEAIHYIDHVIDADSKAYIMWGTIGLLFVFAVLNFIGIGESASVALLIFLVHVATLAILTVACFITVCKNGFGMAKLNYDQVPYANVASGIFYGFSAAMLGITGFESSANYVEEQKPGVYVKTLRNMWWLCTLFNVFTALGTVLTVDIAQAIADGKQSTMIAVLAQAAGGDWLETLVALDAFFVLAGGVLTAYVGVTGLVRRLALDRCLPQWLLARNAWRGTNHWIIFVFFVLCTSMYLALKQNVKSLGDCYSISFLSVMGLFALGVMMLKVKRSTLVAEVSSGWIAAIVALCAVSAGIVGAILSEPGIVIVFIIYFGTAWGLINIMFYRFQVLKLLLYFSKRMPCGSCRRSDGPVASWLTSTMVDIRDKPMAFFAKQGNLSVLNKAVLYVKENEDCSWLRIIHVFEREEDIPPRLYRNVHLLNEEYPTMKIDLVLVKGRFTPAMVAYVSVKLNISRNHIFITTPQPGFSHKLEDLGGVRLVTH